MQLRVCLQQHLHNCYAMANHPHYCRAFRVGSSIETIMGNFISIREETIFLRNV